MTHHITLKDQVNARPAETSLVLSWREGVPMRLSDLLRERVMLEWDRSNGPDPVARPLVGLAADRGTTSLGATRRGGTVRPAGMSRDDAVALALHGFERNAFLVIVDDRQVTELDAEIRLGPGTEITFVRLVPLFGG